MSRVGDRGVAGGNPRRARRGFAPISAAPRTGGSGAERKCAKCPRGAERRRHGAGNGGNSHPRCFFFLTHGDSAAQHTHTRAGFPALTPRIAARGRARQVEGSAAAPRGTLVWEGGGYSRRLLPAGWGRVLRDPAFKNSLAAAAEGFRGSSTAPQALRRFFFFLTLFVPIDVVPQATPRQRLSVLPSRCPPARSRSCGMRWGSALLCVWGQERRCRTGAVPAPRRCLCVRPEVTLAAIAIRVLGW